MPKKTSPNSQTGEIPRVELDAALQAARSEAAQPPRMPSSTTDSASTGMIPRSLLVSSEDREGGAPSDADSPGGA